MLLALILIVLFLLMYYLKRKYFTLRGSLPGQSPHFLFGNLIQTGVILGGKSLPQAIATFKKRFGDTFQFWIGPSRFIVVNGIDDVQHIFTNRNIYDQGALFIQQLSVFLPDGLVCTKGAKFKRHASATLPLFRRGKITPNFDLILNCVDKLLVKWRAAPTKHVHTNIIANCQTLLLTIFGFIGFDYDFQILDDDSHTSTNELTQALQDFMNAFEIAMYMPKWISAPYLKLNRRHRRAQAIIERYLYRMIDQALLESPESVAQRKRTCLIASLVASLQIDEKAEASKSEEDKKGLSRREVLNEMLVFLIAGFETTSTALAWFIHLMSKHPQVQQKIKAELMDHGQANDLSLDRLDSLAYLDCVINEVFRYLPPANATFRTLTVDDRLPDSGVQLYEGDSVLLPFHNLAHDPRYWSIDPELFYPERFLGKDKNHHPYALIPFGAGHRQCIGQHLARFEFKVIAARLMQQVTFGDGGPEVNAGGYLTRATIMPKHVGVTIEFG